MASGALDDVTSTGQDDIARELNALSATSEVDSELAAMKQQLGAGSARPALEDGSSPTSPQATEQPVQREDRA
jgi:phage shock protein A